VPAVWTCPVCERKIPERVSECDCGVRKAQALRHARAHEEQAREERGGSGWRWSLLALAGAGGLLAAALAWQPRDGVRPPEIEPPPTTIALEATVPPPLGARTPYPTAATPPPPLPLQTVAPPEKPSPSPSASPSPDAGSPVDDTRVRGAEAFQSAVAGIARQADDLRFRTREYSRQCETSPQVTRTIGCDDVRRVIEADLGRMTRALDDADDAARRAWVSPGTRRQIRGQLQVDDTIAQLQRQLAEAGSARP